MSCYSVPEELCLVVGLNVSVARVVKPALVRSLTTSLSSVDVDWPGFDIGRVWGAIAVSTGGQGRLWLPVVGQRPTPGSCSPPSNQCLLQAVGSREGAVALARYDAWGLKLREARVGRSLLVFGEQGAGGQYDEWPPPLKPGWTYFNG